MSVYAKTLTDWTGGNGPVTGGRWVGGTHTSDRRYSVHACGPRELAMVGASNVLALDAGALGGSVRLRMQAPEAEATTHGPDADGTPGDVVGIVRIEGPLAQRATADLCAYVDGYDAVAARFEDALTSDVDSVLMVIDSPGGDVAGLSEAVERMRRAKVASGKNVVVYVDEMAASAAYWIAAGVADEIVVPSSGRVGSIGCIGAFVDESGAWAQAGVAWHVERSPAGKAEMMPAAPLTELATARLRERVSAMADTFIDAVAMYRPKTTAKKIRGLDAAMLAGQAAVDEGLADRVGTLEDALMRARELAGEVRQRAAKEADMSVTKLLGLSPEVQAGQVETVVGDAVAALELATGATGLVASVAKVTAMAATIEHGRAAMADASARIASLEAQVQAQSDEQEAAKVAALVHDLVTSGRLPPARRAAFEASARENGLAWAESTAEFLPKLISARSEMPAESSAAPVDELTARELAMCAELKINATEYAARKATARKVA